MKTLEVLPPPCLSLIIAIAKQGHFADEANVKVNANLFDLWRQWIKQKYFKKWTDHPQGTQMKSMGLESMAENLKSK